MARKGEEDVRGEPRYLYYILLYYRVCILDRTESGMYWC